MTDKELLELAAKAAGITGEYDSGTIIMVCDSEGEEPEKLLARKLPKQIKLYKSKCGKLNNTKLPI